METLQVIVPSLKKDTTIRYGFDCTVNTMIKNLKEYFEFDEKIQCGIYHPRQGMWLDSTKSLFSYDLANQVLIR
jgi:hypothetical protein